MMTGLALGLVLLIVPGLYIAARWAITLPLILLDGAGIGQTLSRSWRLTERSAWALVGFGLILAVPETLFGLIGDNGVPVDFLRPTFGMAFELCVDSLIVAFQTSAIVFAHGQLESKADSPEECLGAPA